MIGVWYVTAKPVAQTRLCRLLTTVKRQPVDRDSDGCWCRCYSGSGGDKETILSVDRKKGARPKLEPDQSYEVDTEFGKVRFASGDQRWMEGGDIFFDKISEHSLDTYDEVDVLRLRATQALWAE